jgi:hypothetical protein
MKRTIITLLLFCLAGVAYVGAQSGALEGLWQGTMTLGGLESKKKVKFELYLQKKKSKIVGRSYLHLSDTRIIEMEVQGTLYGDLSIYLRESEFVPFPGTEEEKPPEFNRKYQLMYMPSIWNTKMEGFWQEITGESFSENRKLGRIKLKKLKDPKRA